jgi:GAF domain-containing protein
MSYSESQLAASFVEIADILVDDFDVVDVLTTVAEHCASLLGAPEVGLMLIDDAGVLQVIGSSTSRMHSMELFELQNEEGPCFDCFKSGVAVLNQDLDHSSKIRWPRFANEARAAGFYVVHALPMRLRKETIGTLNIFNDSQNYLSESDSAVAQALADAATIAILQDKALQQATLMAQQLQHALSSRVVIEQAKGFVAERLNVDIDAAFQALRRYARTNNERIADVARDVVDRRLDADALINVGGKT